MILIPPNIRYLHITRLPRHPASGGRKPPVFRAGYQSLPAGIVMQIVKFLLPEGFAENTHRVLGQLPKSMLPVLSSVLLKYLHIDLWQVEGGMVQQPAAGELAHIVQGMFQPVRIELRVEQNGMQVGGHDDIGIHAQEFIADAEVEAVGNDLAGSFIDEDREPVHDGEGDIINGDVFDDTVTFHG